MMKNKTFILFSQFYLPHMGGIEKYVNSFATELKSKGFEVIIVTAKLNKKEKINDKNKNIYLNCISALNGRFLIPYSISQIFKLVQKIKKIKKQSEIIIIGQTRFFPISILGAVLAFFMKIKCIIIDHSSNYLPAKNILIKNIFIAYEKFTTTLLKKINVKFAGVSNASINWLKNFNISTNLIISNGIKISKIDNVSKKISKTIKITNGKIVVFASGRLIQEKGFLEIVAAFNKFSKNKNNYMLLIAGEGELKKEIIKKINKKTLFLGKLNNNEIMKLLKNCDLYILASKYPEGLPTVLLEAGISSVPIMSTENGGSKEILGEGKRGIILNNNSIEEIKNKLSWFDSHQSNAKIMANELNKYVIKNYNWEKIVNKFLINYEEKN